MTYELWPMKLKKNVNLGLGLYTQGKGIIAIKFNIRRPEIIYQKFEFVRGVDIKKFKIQAYWWRICLDSAHWLFEGFNMHQ